MFTTEVEKRISNLIEEAIKYCNHLYAPYYDGITELNLELSNLFSANLSSFATKLNLKDFYYEKYEFSEELEELKDMVEEISQEIALMVRLDILCHDKIITLYTTCDYEDDNAITIPIENIKIYRDNVSAIRTTEYNNGEYTGERISVRKKREENK